MCGIAGCVPFSRDSAGSAVEGTRRMLQRMRARGPDAEGILAEDGVVLGHRRLAILDLAPRANQPMRSSSRRLAIVFNGEIYNFRELRETLQRQGVRFHTTSDTEVLLELYERDGAGMLGRLRGMFALAIWDADSRELFLARDPYGIKPLYYSQTRHGFFFASQVKALVSSGLVADAREPAGEAGFYLWGSVPEPWTLYKNVMALPAGHSLRIREDRAASPICWHDIRVHWQDDGHPRDRAGLQDLVRDALSDSVRAHLVSDVPISVFLSGGVDSTVVAALAAEQGARVHGITVGFTEFAGDRHDELPRAAATAAHYGLRHTERLVTRDEFIRDAPRILAAMDQPSIDGVNTWFASKAAAELGYKVVLSGVGGDELFCGYSTFARVRRTATLGRAVAATAATRALSDRAFRYLGRHWCHPKLAAIPTVATSFDGAYFLHRCLFLPDELPMLMEAEAACEGLKRLDMSRPPSASAGPRDHIAAVGVLESTRYLRNQLLRDSDWASMDHSLELRTPLVDVSLLTALGPFVAVFAGGVGKALMARSPRQSVPTAITKGPKTGFAVPMARWVSATVDALPHRRQAPASRRSWPHQWATVVLGEALACA